MSGPAGRIGPFRNGAALIALRTGAPVVPLAMAGTEELYIGRRMASRVLPPTSARELLGDAWDGMLPPEGSREELELARRLTARFEALLGPAVEALQPGTVDPPSHPRRLRRRLTWLFLRPGRLDRRTRGRRREPIPGRRSRTSRDPGAAAGLTGAASPGRGRRPTAAPPCAIRTCSGRLVQRPWALERRRSTAA